MKWLKEKLSPHGNFWSRALDTGAATWPEFLEPIFVPVYSLLFYSFIGKQRRAVAANLSVVFPERPGWVVQLMTLRLFTSFAFSITDAARCRPSGNEPPIDWEFDGMEPFSELAEGEAGTIVLTAHMGNYDVGATMYAQNFERRLNTVRAPERDPKLQRIREEQIAERNDSSLGVHFNASESMLGLQLSRLLEAGELVAIQGDWVVFDVSEMAVVFDESHEMIIPKGPFVLSQMTGCSFYPLFVIRRGWRRYRIVVREGFGVEKVPSNLRESSLQEAAERWIEMLRPMIREHWHQWYVFDEVFQRR